MTPRPCGRGDDFNNADYDMQSTSLARSASAPKPPATPGPWRDQVREAFRDAGALLDFLGVAANAPEIRKFPMLVPRAFAARMEPGNPHDPLLLQVLPDHDENRMTDGFVADPVGDRESRQARGLLHKYHGRVLLVSTGACAVHCRYCFRQSFPYAANHAGFDQWKAAVDYIARDRQIDEVILSGGDPLMLSTRRLEELTSQLAKIDHIHRIRIHTRLPVVLPDRVTDRLLEWLGQLPWPVVMVVHANHANEFDSRFAQAASRLRGCGVHLLNQAVVLAGINDSVEDLRNLMVRGLDTGILPYYLHLLDRVAGAARYEVDEAKASLLVDQLRHDLSGYLVPRLVREVAGAPYKLPIL